MSAGHLLPAARRLAEIEALPAEQRSAAWFALRMGRFTGSKFFDVMARNKKTGEPLKAYHDLVWKIVVERLTGEPVEGPSGYALQWGTDVEPAGREAVSLFLDRPIAEVGFLVHPVFDYAGASPDGLIDADGGLELKCPKDPAVHLSRFTEGMPDEYFAQCQGGMWVTGRRWWVFASFDPRMPLSHQLYLQMVERDDAYITRMEAAIVEAEQLVQQRMASVAQSVKKIERFRLPT